MSVIDAPLDEPLGPPAAAGHPREAAAGRSVARVRATPTAIVDLIGVMLAFGVSLQAGDAAAAGLLPWTYPCVLLWAQRANRTLWTSGTLLDELRQIAAATSVSALALLGADSLLGVSGHGSLALRLWLLALVFLAVGRIALAWFGSRTRALRATLIVGTGAVGTELAERLAREPRHGLRPVGFLDVGSPSPTAGLPLLGAPDQLAQAIAATGARCVAFAFTPLPDERLLPLIQECTRGGVEVFVVPRLFEALNSRLRLRYVGALPLGEFRVIDPRGLRFAAKYALDRVLAALLLAPAVPALLVIAALVRASSPGPVLFRQRRVGRDGREFTMLKFRTMRVGELVQFKPPAGCAPGGVECEDRRTRIGTWLRRASLDELPQLINVVRGEMSLIGPRPERPEYVTRFGGDLARYGERHRVKSGITGLAQVSGLRGQTSVRERIALDNFYIENWSPWLDVKIALRTVVTILTLRGA